MAEANRAFAHFRW